ncbi:PREDICTED: BPI fold-containing family B member 2 [Chinchilla lanigera]|uniref:BPI fold containing family B member 2 n=1 Tax=Chinchilla lanigera TaxID=34839 RepID=A0A8C2W4J1_CHILA|nr:PREDICTED: BPI fold-containing family B member 2 [Chinchilla lanigera]XP_013369325.1 PREDICTED: BPI fold-containing family B member 2 [Chinchilla lanigera]XP_013369326.1 PREDICTED: BPI fold-containing family B member 2 [Chinchilla lanigera]XP_013369327.1 PREDICTED: BPI fold-containing family B member 2 [Chinchilla lanigera]XP_013369328.1 PREDICTED: BPI fold-containing family B member 2 [Chinchilla lanigera]
MAGVHHGLGLLLVLLLPAVPASSPGTVVRINRAALSYVSDVGKVPLQHALKIIVPPFLDWSGEMLQPTRIQILGVHVPHLDLKFIAGFGLHLMATANFTIKVFSVPEPLELILPMTLTADARVAQGPIRTPVVSISTCSPLFSPASVLDGSNSTSPMLLVLVQKHVKAILSNKVCLRISNLVQGLNVHLGTLIGLSPVGPESQIRYSMISEPVITGDYIALDVNAVLFLLGQPIVLPLDAASFVLPWPVGVKGAMATLGLSQQLFDCVLLLLQKAGALNLDVTGELNSEDNPLNTSALGRLIPEVARQFPNPMPLVLKVQLGATPAVTFHPHNATLRLQPFVEVLAVSSNSAFQSLFSLEVVVNLSLQLSVSKVKLRGATSVLGDIRLVVAASNVGFVDVEQVHALVGTLFEKPLLDHLNALLGMGIALPSVVNLYFTNPEVFVYEGYVVISSGLFYQR